jgi:hypothetical protein
MCTWNQGTEQLFFDLDEPRLTPVQVYQSIKRSETII